MNTDEFAFFNQQLAAMLRDGIPLEGALQQLCAEMQPGSLQQEIQLLQVDLAKGIQLNEAISRRQLPELYQSLIVVGAQSQNLPDVLTLTADYYRRRYLIWTRLKGLLVYPLIVLCASFLLSVFLAYALERIVWPSMAVFSVQMPPGLRLALWFPPVTIGVALGLFVIGSIVPPARQTLRWRIRSFREASLAQIAATLGLLIRNGLTLDHALSLVERLEQNTRAGVEIAAWRRRLSDGHAKFADIAQPSRVFPPLFIWLVAQDRENLATGFQRAAEVYQSRANHRAELLLYSILPCSVLALGFLIIMQIQPIFASLTHIMNMLGE